MDLTDARRDLLRAIQHELGNQRGRMAAVCAAPCNQAVLASTNTVIAETESKWPPNSLELSVTGPEYSNFLAYNKVGASTTTYLQSDFWVLVPTGVPSGNYQALEYDIFEYLSPYEFMWGSQCVVGANWQIWDALHQAWINTTRSCALLGGLGTTCNGGCIASMATPLRRLSLHALRHARVDAVYTQLNTTQPSGPMPTGWSNNRV